MTLDNSLTPQTLLRHGALLFFAVLNFSMLCVSVIMGYKLISFMGFTLSAGIFAFPLSYVCEDIVAEVYGYRVSRLLIWVTFSCLLIFSLFITFLVKIQPASVWHNEQAYVLALGGTLRLALAIVFSVIIGDFINAILLTKWKVLLKGKSYWLRSLGSTTLGELSDTFIGFGIAFIGVLPFSAYLKIAALTFLVKLFWTVLFVFPASLIVVIMKKKLQLNVFDYE